MAQTLIIHSRAGQGFRRGGVVHPVGRAEHPLEAFSAEQLAAIRAEPLLAVEIAGKPDKKAGE